MVWELRDNQFSNTTFQRRIFHPADRRGSTAGLTRKNPGHRSESKLVNLSLKSLAPSRNAVTRPTRSCRCEGGTSTGNCRAHRLQKSVFVLSETIPSPDFASTQPGLQSLQNVHLIQSPSRFETDPPTGSTTSPSTEPFVKPSAKARRAAGSRRHESRNLRGPRGRSVPQSRRAGGTAVTT